MRSSQLAWVPTPGRETVDDDFEDTSDCVAGAEGDVDFGLHALLVLGVDAVQKHFVPGLECCNLVP